MDTADDEPIAPGTIVGGDYEILRELGRGGMGAVYEARQRSTGVHRALKVMHRDLLDDPHLRRRFRDEATIVGSIESEHVVRVIAAGIDESTAMPWVAMELLRGATLDAFIAAKGPPSFPQAREILAQIADALGAAHRHEPMIVHRDLKPENVFLADSASAGSTIDVKLLDFGIAKVIDPIRRRGTASVAIGSPQWMAPEQFEEAAKITASTDVWAFALVAFFVFTGHPYWKAANAKRVSRAELFAEVCAGTSAPASERAIALAGITTLPRGFDAWFAKATSMDASSRYHDATEAFTALRSLGPPDATVGSIRSVRRALLVGVVLALATGGTAALTAIATGRWPGHSRTHPGSNPNTVPSQIAARPLSVDASLDPRSQDVSVPAMPVVASPFDAGQPDASHPPSRAVAVPLRPAPHDPSCPEGAIRIQAGSFVMGSVTATRFTNQLPSHLVTLSSFCIDRTEVTAAQYNECAAAGGCPPAQQPPNAGREWQYLCNALQPDRASHPMNCVSWAQADAYCTWAHRRLPTEAEWEFAARGRMGRHYPWGDEPAAANRLNAAGIEWTGPDAGDYLENDGFPTTAPVGSFPGGATPEGVLDLAGNVSEWVADWAAPYSPEPQRDPVGPDHGTSRVARGGGWLDPPLSATWRERINPVYVGRSLGFRCAASVVAP